MVDKQRKLPELLAPAGDMERLKMAVLYGADAVYLAGTDFGMRAFAGNFDPDELKAAAKRLENAGADILLISDLLPVMPLIRVGVCIAQRKLP